MPKFYSIANAARIMEISYQKARVRFAAAGVLHPHPDNAEKLVVSSRDLLKVLKDRKSSKKLIKSLEEDVKSSVHMIPLCPESGAYAAKRELILALPLFQGLIDNKDLLSKILLYGKYRWKFIGGTQRYYMEDFLLPDKWRSPAEECFYAMSGHLAQHDHGDPESTAHVARNLAHLWADWLKEERLGLQRATGNLTDPEFRERYAKTKESVYKNEAAWTSAELKAMLPQGFQVEL